MKYPKVLVWIVVLLLWGNLPGCDSPQKSQQIAALKSSFFDPHLYVVKYSGFPIGTYIRSASLTDDDAYEFRTTLTMPSANGLTLITESLYQFRPRSPYRLSSATRTTSTTSKERPYRVEHLYPSHINDPKDRTNETIQKGYGLREFFALELALMDSFDAVDNERQLTVLTPFHETNNSTKWTIKDFRDESITLSSSVGELATYSFKQELPSLEELVDGSGLSMTRISSDEFAGLSYRTPHVVEDIRIPIDQPIANPSSLASMSIQFEFDNGDPGPWSSLLDATNSLSTSIELGTSSYELVKWDQKNFSAHTTHRLRSIVSDVTAGIETREQIANALMAYVNRTITYTDRNTLQSIEETLAHKNGDCTEFSQLFTALASAAELTARTVVGLAYHESSQTFGIHAWNEVLFEDGSTQSLDPTWNQIRADATHIEFPPGYQHEIVPTLKNLRIKVLNLEYEQDHST